MKLVPVLHLFLLIISLFSFLISHLLVFPLALACFLLKPHRLRDVHTVFHQLSWWILYLRYINTIYKYL